MDSAAIGAAALEAKKPLEAVVAYTKALIEHPTSPEYYTHRSTAFTRLSPPKYNLALQDAEKAVLYAYHRSKRDSIHAAQHRRVISLFNVGRYADAKFLLDTLKPRVDKTDRKGTMLVDMWMAKIEGKLKTATDEQKVVTVEEKPSIQLPSERERVDLLRQQLGSDGSYIIDGETVVDTTPAPVAKPVETATTTSAPAAPAAAGTIRHEWYQNPQAVVVTLYAKGVDKDKVEGGLNDDSISISFPHPADATKSVLFTLDPLFASIDAANSSHRVLSSKVELTLKKAVQGQKWAALKGTKPLEESADIQDQPTAGHISRRDQLVTDLVKEISSSDGSLMTPSYPTSSKNGPKNWDKLADELTRTKKSNNDNEEDQDPDDDTKVDSDDEVSGDAVDSFFKKLYKGADDDMRRAMMKSFQESNGTALSTNWEEVGKKRVEVVESKADR